MFELLILISESVQKGDTNSEILYFVFFCHHQLLTLVIIFCCRLRDVFMDVAELRETGQETAYAVEQCACPIGYIGLSCEVCCTL